MKRFNHFNLLAEDATRRHSTEVAVDGVSCSEGRRARLHEHPYCSATHPSACRFLGRVQAALMRLSVVIDAGVKRMATTAPDVGRAGDSNPTLGSGPDAAEPNADL